MIEMTSWLCLLIFKGHDKISSKDLSRFFSLSFILYIIAEISLRFVLHMVMLIIRHDPNLKKVSQT